MDYGLGDSFLIKLNQVTNNKAKHSWVDVFNDLGHDLEVIANNRLVISGFCMYQFDSLKEIKNNMQSADFEIIIKSYIKQLDEQIKILQSSDESATIEKKELLKNYRIDNLSKEEFEIYAKGLVSDSLSLDFIKTDDDDSIDWVKTIRNAIVENIWESVISYREDDYFQGIAGAIDDVQSYLSDVSKSSLYLA
ncbi:MAG: hypothetical protein WCQ49_02085 [Candidatus Saccharibacteria bacterium]